MNNQICEGYCHCGCGQRTKIATKTYKKLSIKDGEPFRYIKGHSGGRRGKTLEQRFWGKVNKTDTCWLWTGYSMPFGHGQIKTNKGIKLVHRLSWEFHYGSIPKGMCVCHHCDVPQCIRPDHLFLGDMSANITDMINKKRNRPPKGENHPNAKLTIDSVKSIRILFDTGNFTKVELGKQFGVVASTIEQVLSRETWRDVE